MWQGSPQLFTAMFKAVEDRLNMKKDTEYGVLGLVRDPVHPQRHSSGGKHGNGHAPWCEAVWS